MMRKRLLLLIAGFVLVLANQPTRAHHSEAAEFDATKPVKVTGTLKRLEWANPHVWFFVDVTGPDGKVATWGFETQPPGALMRRGVLKETFKIGAVVNAEGVRARDGSTNASTRRLTYADGQNVLAPPDGAR